jgi:hypothetical protein
MNWKKWKTIIINKIDYNYTFPIIIKLFKMYISLNYKFILFDFYYFLFSQKYFGFSKMDKKNVQKWKIKKSLPEKKFCDHKKN